MAIVRKTIPYKGTTISGMYDTETGKLTVVDENDNPTGRVLNCHVAKKTPLQQPASAPVPETEPVSKNNTDTTNETVNETVPDNDNTPVLTPDSQEKEKPQKKSEKKKKSNAGAVITIIVCILLITGIILFAVPKVLAGFNIQLPWDLGNAPPPVDQTQTQTETVEPIVQNSGNVEVIKLKQSILKGATITEDYFEKIKISGRDYNDMLLTGNKIVRYDQLNDILDLYAVKYLPEGSYLFTENCVADNPYKGVTNPWLKDNGDFHENTISVKDYEKRDAITFGSYVNITVTRDIKEEDISRMPIERYYYEIDKLDYDRTKTDTGCRETFVFKNVEITDLIRSDGSGLYMTYNALADIPVADLKDYISRLSPETIADMSPSDVKIIMDNRRGSVFENLLQYNCTPVITSVSDKPDTGNTAKDNFMQDYQRIRALMEPAPVETETETPVDTAQTE